MKERFQNTNYVKIVNYNNFTIDRVSFSEDEIYYVNERYSLYKPYETWEEIDYKSNKAAYIDTYNGSFILYENDKYYKYKYRTRNIWLKCGISKDDIISDNYLNANDINISYTKGFDKVSSMYLFDLTEEDYKPVFTGKIYIHSYLDDNRAMIIDTTRNDFYKNDFSGYYIKFQTSMSHYTDKSGIIIESGINEEGKSYIIYDDSEGLMPMDKGYYYIYKSEEPTKICRMPEYVYIDECLTIYGYPNYSKYNIGGKLTNNDIKTNLDSSDGNVILEFDKAIDGADTWIDDEFKNMYLCLTVNPIGLDQIYYKYERLFLIESNTKNTITIKYRNPESTPWSWDENSVKIERLTFDNEIKSFELDLSEGLYYYLGNIDIYPKIYESINDLEFGKLTSEGLKNPYNIDTMNFNTTKRITITGTYKSSIDENINYSNLKLLMNYKV